MSKLQGAETALIKYLYLCDFFFARIVRERIQSSPTSLLKLGPYAHKSIIRVGGHLSQTDVVFDLKNRLILPSDLHFTKFLICQRHAEVRHSGASHSWASLRQNFGIVKGGTAVRKSLGQCISLSLLFFFYLERRYLQYNNFRSQINRHVFPVRGSEMT